uniref:Sec-independent protein translocase protein TatC n=1 Tax=Archaeoglobus fulgidus TaxID=2234 RepID=A0A7C3RIW1_ARCFL
MEARDWLAVIARLRKEFLKVALIIIAVSSLFFTFGASLVIGKIIGDLFPGEAVIENREKILAIAVELRKIASDLENYALYPSETNQSLAFTASKNLVRLAMQLSTSPVLITPLEGLLLYLKISLAVGIAAALPYILHIILATLRDRGVISFSLRRTTAFKYGIAAALLFILGVIYGYNMMRFFISFLYMMAVSQGAIPLYSLSEFVNFVALMLVLFGMVFELPLVMFFLVRNKIVSYETLSYYRRHIYVAFFVIGAITTPPDVFTQIMVAVPMVIFFEISLLLVRIYAR